MVSSPDMASQDSEEGAMGEVTTPARYAKARNDLFSGLTDILQRMVDDEEAGVSQHDVVLLVGQRLEVLLYTIDKILKGQI